MMAIGRRRLTGGTGGVALGSVASVARMTAERMTTTSTPATTGGGAAIIAVRPVDTMMRVTAEMDMGLATDGRNVTPDLRMAGA